MIMDVPKEVPTLGSLVGLIKNATPNQVIQSPFHEGHMVGWAKVWKNSEGQVWSQIKLDNGEDCPLLEPKLEIPAKPRKPRNNNYNIFGNRWKKKTKVVGHI
jgi:hypothetical protein